MNLRNKIIKILGGYTEEEMDDNMGPMTMNITYATKEEKTHEYHPFRGTGTNSTSTVPGNEGFEIHGNPELYLHEKLEPKKKKQRNGTKRRSTRSNNNNKQ